MAVRYTLYMNMKRTILLLHTALVTTIVLLSSGCSNSSAISHRYHTGNDPFAPRIEQANNSNDNAPHHIALLLPLTDRYAPYANAIRNGFFTAYYEQKKKTGYAPNIEVINTSGKNIHTVVQSAIADQADMIVGPLDKTDVATLAASKTTTIPIIALNTTPENTGITNQNLYEFGLSPANEAQQSAEKAWQDGKRNVIILAPNSPYGERVAGAFAAQWKQLGGSIVAQQYYGNIPTLSKSIMDVLQIDNADQNARKLKKLFRDDIRFVPQRRQDFDSIFLVATPVMGRQIQPLLRFYFAGDIPIYSISQIYSGVPDASRDHDLDGIIFCDMPWILSPTQLPSDSLRNMQQQIQTLWPTNAVSLAKFYAMGVDAFTLASQLNKMISHPMSLPGATGTLYITPQHHIDRKLPFAQFQQGEPTIR